MSDLLGRDRERDAALAVALGTTNELAVVIEGAAGIGKTIVLDAVLDAVRAQGLQVLETRPAESEARIGLLGLHDMLDPHLPAALTVLPGPQRAHLEAALGLRPASEDGIDETLLAVALVNVLRALADRHPVVIAIDDVQWLDASTASLLQVAIRRLQGAPLRLIATRRDRGMEGNPLVLSDLYRDRLLAIDLAGMSVGALHRLIASRLGLSLARPALIRLHADTQGNPLYALELARSASDRGAWTDSPGGTLPRAIGPLLGRRIGRLGPAERNIVTVVALAPRLPSTSIARTLDLSPAGVERAARSAIDAGLLVDTAWGLGLAHPLVGAAASERLSAAERRELHRRLATIVEDPDKAALHLAMSTSGPDEGIATALEVAAQRGVARGATIEAIDLLDHSIQLTPSTAIDALVRRRVALARALILAGDTRRSIGMLRELDVDAISDLALRADVVLLLGVVQRYTGEHAAAIVQHREALTWVTDPPTRARFHLRLAWLIELDLRSALEHATEALAGLDPRSAPIEYGFALLLRARLELALAIRADHEAIARGTALQEGVGRRDWNVSIIPIDWAIWMDDWDGARAMLQHAVRTAEESGDEPSLGHLLRRRVEVETWSGNLVLAAELADAALERAESTQQLLSVASAKARRGLIRAVTGDIAAADREGRESLAIAEAQGNSVIIGYALTCLGAAARLQDDFPAVDQHLTRATDVLDATGDIDQPAFRFHADHLDALVALGDLDRARDLVARLDRRGGLGPRPTWAGIAERGRAAIAIAEGRLDEAAAHLEVALQFHASQLVPLETARTILLAAHLARRVGRRKATAARLQEAVEILERIGATGWATRAQRDLERLTRDRIDANALTPSEERVAELAATGLRNREIAQRMSISEKTVEASLTRTYEKLMIRSRAQLAGGLAQAAQRRGRESS